MRLHFAPPRMTIGSYYTCMIHTFTRLTLISLILPNSQNAFYKVCTYTANSYKKRWPNHQYNIRPFKRVLKNKNLPSLQQTNPFTFTDNNLLNKAIWEA